MSTYILSEEETILKKNIDAWLESVKALQEDDKNEHARKMSSKKANKLLYRGLYLLEMLINVFLTSSTAVLGLGVTLISTIISYINDLLRIIRRDEEARSDPRLKDAIRTMDKLEKKAKKLGGEISEKLLKVKEFAEEIEGDIIHKSDSLKQAFSESNLSASELKDIPNKDFGLPSERRYPMNDKEHVLAAIRMFNHVEEKNERELAHNIMLKMQEYDIPYSSVTTKNRLYTYLPDNAKNDIENEDEIMDTLFIV